MSKMRYQAVIFDFFGTLVPPYSSKQYEPVLSKMAETLAAPREEFMNMWLHNTLVQRTIGLLPTDEAAIAYICHALDIRSRANQIASAANYWLTFERQLIKPLPDAIPVLTSLKEMGSKTGLISNCGPNLPKFWLDTPFAPLVDVPVFSSIAGLRKPESRIYRLTCDQIAVQPEHCLYVGDGGAGELSGAAKVGMHAVLIRTSADTDGYKPLERVEWQGAVITSLKKIPAILYC
jgi:putative hydrolase of the HAD superfamily